MGGPFLQGVLVMLAAALSPALALDNGIGRTPMMGWMAWIRFRCNVNCELDPKNCIGEQLFMEMADAMVEGGFADAGYEYISIDDCWQADSRGPRGELLANSTRFPSGMKALAAYIHGKGLKFGLYTAMGEGTCQGYPALNCSSVDSCQQGKADAQTFIDWDIDYIKVDSCQGCNNAAFNTTHPLMSSYFLEGGRRTGRPVLYHPSGIALESVAVDLQYRLFGKIANLWRHFADMQPRWSEVAAIIEFWAADTEAGHPTHGAGPAEWENFLTVSRPGVVQDPDALLLGNVNDQKSCRKCLDRKPRADFCPNTQAPDAPCICCGTLAPAEELTNMVMWAMWAAPLEIGADLRAIPAASAAILLNREIIAVNQDPLVYQARRVSGGNSSLQVWRKRLVDDSVAVALHNSKGAASPAALDFVSVGFTGFDRVHVRDLVNHVDLGEFTGSVQLPQPIPAHGTALLNLTILW